MSNILNAAEFIVTSRLARSVLLPIPEYIRPVNIEEGYYIQEAAHDILGRNHDLRSVGYKIGCTTPVMQQNLGINHPCAGRISNSTVFHSSAELAITDFVNVGVECEIGMVLSCDIRPGDGPFDSKNIVAAIGSVMAAVEIVDNRYQGGTSIGVPTLIADDFFGSGAVLGPSTCAWADIDLSALTGRITVDGEVRDIGVSSSVMGNPLEALVWLVNLKSDCGETLNKGEIILTGSITLVQWIETACEVTAEIENLGIVRVKFY